jgi:phosphate uptake regulator
MIKFLQDIFSRKNLLQESIEHSLEMLEIDKEMFDASVKSLREQDSADVEIDIYQTDLQINHLEQEIRKKVLTHLAVSGTAELSIGLTLVSVISDIERIGDYTKNIYELAKEHPQRLFAGKWEQDLKEMERTVSTNLGALLEAFKENDVEKAQKIIDDIARVKKKCDKYVLFLLKGEHESFKTNEAVPLVLYMRYLKRVAGHIQNVTSSIVNPFHRLKYMDERIKLID